MTRPIQFTYPEGLEAGGQVELHSGDMVHTISAVDDVALNPDHSSATVTYTLEIQEHNPDSSIVRFQDPLSASFGVDVQEGLEVDEINFAALGDARAMAIAIVTNETLKLRAERRKVREELSNTTTTRRRWTIASAASAVVFGAGLIAYSKGYETGGMVAAGAIVPVCICPLGAYLTNINIVDGRRHERQLQGKISSLNETAAQLDIAQMRAL